MNSLEEKVKQLQEHLSFIKRIEGWKIYGFRINVQPRKLRGKIEERYYASKTVESKKYHVYLNTKVTSLDEVKEKISQKIKEKSLPESLIELGVEKE